MKTYPLRLRPGEDLKGALDALLVAEGWGAAWVVSGIGSLAAVAVAVRYADSEEAVLLEGRFEILSLAGTLSVDGSHLHISVSDGDGRVCGGHLKQGAMVYTTAEILVVVLEGWVFSREVDAGTGFLELRVREGNR